MECVIMVSAKDDEPQFVKDYNRKSGEWVTATVFSSAAMYVVGAVLSGESLFEGLSVLSLVLGMGSWAWWAHKRYPPVRAWRETWLREHRWVEGKNHDSQDS